MNNLDKIQKTVKVFKELSLVAAILAFVSAFLMLASIGVWYGTDNANITYIAELTRRTDFNETLSVLWCDFVLCLTDGILFAFAYRYLTHELADGTPFTERGANEIRFLGIKTIVMPLVAVIICGVICNCIGTDAPENISNETSAVFGIALIIISLVFAYGAELERKNEPNEVNAAEDMKEKSEE